MTSNRRERTVSVAVVTVPAVAATETSDVAAPVEVPGVEAAPEPDATPAAEPITEEPAGERGQGKRRRK